MSRFFYLLLAYKEVVLFDEFLEWLQKRDEHPMVGDGGIMQPIPLPPNQICRVNCTRLLNRGSRK